TDLTQNAVTIEADKVTFGDSTVAEIPLDAIVDARLILTDDLIRAALRADKAARQARGLEIEDEDTVSEGDTEA
ncbi:MAG: ribosome maturation factor RimP, partial [Oricola sp.]